MDFSSEFSPRSPNPPANENFSTDADWVVIQKPAAQRGLLPDLAAKTKMVSVRLLIEPSLPVHRTKLALAAQGLLAPPKAPRVSKGARKTFRVPEEDKQALEAATRKDAALSPRFDDQGRLIKRTDFHHFAFMAMVAESCRKVDFENAPKRNSNRAFTALKWRR